MDARVKHIFRDKYTNRRYKVGEVITITEERFEEILSVGDLVEAVETVEETEKKPAKKGKKKSE
jgi:hypothetical protein